MTKPDNGIVLGKSLAWAVLTALIVGGIWIGLQVQELANVTVRLDRASTRITALEGRAATVERDIAVMTAQLGMILSVVERTDQRLSKMEDLRK